MGNGQAVYDATSGVQRYFIDLMVASSYDASQIEASSSSSDTLRWQRAFEQASLLLFQATEGQMQFGKLYFSNNVPLAGETDVRVANIAGSSSTQTPLSPPFNVCVFLKRHVRQEPLVILHELAHYAMTLRDEYAVDYGSPVTVRRVCQNDATTHESVMEFGRGFGLRLDENGHVSTSQPTVAVNRFCYTNHVPHSDNAQETKHRESCWETMVRIYDQLTFPSGDTPVNAPQPVEWIETLPLSRFVLAVAASPNFAAPLVEQAIKNAAKEWVVRMRHTEAQLSLVLGSAGVIHSMQSIDAQIENSLLAAIDQAELGGPEQPDFLSSASELFPDARAAFQRLVVLMPGASSMALGALSDILPDKRIGMRSRTFGTGDFEGQMAKLADTNKWVEHAGMPTSDQAQSMYAFGLQNELLELYFSSSPGWGIVEWYRGKLPAIEAAGFQPGPPNFESEDGQLALSLEQRSMGIDLPIFIENGAESVTFLLSQPKAGLCELQLVAPDGTPQQAAPHSSSFIYSFDLADAVSGRWILHVRRLQPSGETPIALLSAARNPSLATRTLIELDAREVHFRVQASHEFPLDFIHATVHIYGLLPDLQAPGEAVASLLLHRQRLTDPQSQEAVEGSTGWYVASIQLPAGAYVAEFRVGHHGQATYASNPEGNLHGEIATYPAEAIPAFSRVVRRRFQIPNS